MRNFPLPPHQASPISSLHSAGLADPQLFSSFYFLPLSSVISINNPESAYGQIPSKGFGVSYQNLLTLNLLVLFKPSGLKLGPSACICYSFVSWTLNIEMHHLAVLLFPNGGQPMQIKRQSFAQKRRIFSQLHPLVLADLVAPGPPPH